VVLPSCLWPVRKAFDCGVEKAPPDARDGLCGEARRIAISPAGTPSSLRSTTRARRTKPAASDGLDTMTCSARRCFAFSLISFTRPIMHQTSYHSL